MLDQIETEEKFRIDASAQDDQLKGFLNRHSRIFVPVLAFLILLAPVLYYFHSPALIIPLLILCVFVLLIMYFTERYVGSGFIRQFAKENGYAYSRQGSLDGLDGLIFQFGKEKNVSDVVSGKIEGRDMSLFLFEYKMEQKKSVSRSYITVFKFDIKSSVPHIFLENTRKGFVHLTLGMFRPLEKVQLEGDFDKHFILRVEKEFEMEALQIFSPDIMAAFVDRYRAFGLEIVNNHLYVYKPRLMSNRQELEELYGCAKYLAEKIAPVLDRMDAKTHHNPF